MIARFKWGFAVAIDILRSNSRLLFINSLTDASVSYWRRIYINPVDYPDLAKNTPLSGEIDMLITSAMKNGVHEDTALSKG
jgi:hypothetical protein